MRRLLRAAALGAATAATAVVVVLPASARSTADECRGLQVCIPVAGPWVVIPRSAPAKASWQLTCPNGVVAGLDARVSDRAVDVSFQGLLGSPVNPGITTASSVLFTGTYSGSAHLLTSYKPFIGCIPSAGGGRTPTAYKPGKPVTLRVKTLRLEAARAATATQACAAGERLIAAADAVGLYTASEPTQAQMAAVRATRVVRSNAVVVRASRRGLPASVRVDVQAQAWCARGVGP